MKVNEATGEFSLNLRDRADIRRAHEMLEGQRRVEVERGAENQAALRRERVVRRDGRVVDFPEEFVDTAKKGFRPAGRYGGAPSMRFMPMLGLAPVWSYVCNECGSKNGMWRQWTEPTSVVDECGSCGCDKLSLEEEVDLMDKEN